jgi:MFS family permease
MNVLIAMFAGLAGGALSGVAASFLTVWICQMLGVSNRDGGIGYFGLFMGILAGMVGTVVTIILTLRWRGQSGASVVAQTPMAVAGIIALGALGLWLYYNSKDHPVVDGAPPVLDFELQAPANASLPDPKSIQVRLQAGEKGRDDGWWDEQQTETVEGRPVLTGHMQLYLRTSQRLIVFQFPGGVDQLFQLRLPASPLGRKYQKWSAWQPADFVFTPESRIGQRVPAENAYRMRYLVAGMEH